MIARWRWPVLVALGILTLASLSAMPRLRAEFAPEALVPPAPEEAARERAILGAFEAGGEPMIVVFEGRVLAPPALALQDRIARSLMRRSWVSRVDGMTVTPIPHLAPIEEERATLDTISFDDDSSSDVIGRAIATDPERFPMGLASLAEHIGDRRWVARPVDDASWVEGTFVDRAHTLAVIAVTPKRGTNVEERARELARWLRAQRAPNVRVELSGMPAVRASMVDALERDQVRLVALAVLGSMLVLIVGMRSWSGVILPLASAGMASAFVIGAMAAYGEPINLLNNTIAPLLITIGLGDAVHLIARYREELRRDPDRLGAARRTVRAMASACFLTAATTAIGFGSLVVSDTSIVRRYALLAAGGVLLGFVVTITFLPAALTGLSLRDRPLSKSELLERTAAVIAAICARRAKLVLGAALAVLAIALFVGRDVRVDSTLSGQLDPSARERRTFALLEERLGGVRMLEIGIAGVGAGDLARIAELERWLRAQPGVLRVEGPPDVLSRIWSSLGGEDALESEARIDALVAVAAEVELWQRYVRDRNARIEVRLADAGESATARLLDRLERRLAPWPEHVVGGEAARSARGLDRLIRDLGGSVGLAAVLIFVVIGAFLRSGRLGLISILPNVLPLAYMTVRDIPLHAATTIVFSVSIGLAVDDTIHILARYREEIARGRGRIGAMMRSLRSSGRAALVSAATIWVGYATLMFASFVPIRLFGELSLIALGTALACEIAVLPALLALFGPIRLTK